MDKAKLPVDLSADDYELKRIYLLHQFQGTGVGRALMATAIETAEKMAKKRLLLGVYARNERALSFYKRSGFTQVGERRFQVGGNTYEDVILARALS